MRRKRGFFGDGAAVSLPTAVPVRRRPLGAGVFDVRYDDVGGGGDFTVFQFGQAGGIIKMVEASTASAAAALAVLCAVTDWVPKMVARCEDGLDGKDGSQKRQCKLSTKATCTILRSTRGRVL